MFHQNSQQNFEQFNAFPLIWFFFSLYDSASTVILLFLFTLCLFVSAAEGSRFHLKLVLTESLHRLYVIKKYSFNVCVCIYIYTHSRH